LVIGLIAKKTYLVDLNADLLPPEIKDIPDINKRKKKSGCFVQLFAPIFSV